MKKIFALILSLTILCFSALPVFAAEDNLNNSEKSTGIGVTAQLHLPDGIYSSQTKGGKAEITFLNGVKITVNGAIADNLSLVVMPIDSSDTKALSWFESCMKNIGTNIYPLNIYLLDKDGNRVQPTGTISIVITMLENYKVPIICSISTDGTATLMKFNVSGNIITFTTDYLSYYAIAEKVVTDKPADLDSPQTGDTSNMSLWFAVVVASVGVLTVLMIQKNAKNQ